MPFVLNLDVGEKIFAKLQYIFEFLVKSCQFSVFHCQFSIITKATLLNATAPR